MKRASCYMCALYEHPGSRELRRKFLVYDSDDSGSISLSELGHLISDLGHDLSKEEIQLCFKQYDIDGSGRIEFGEFTRWWEDGGGLGGIGEVKEEVSRSRRFSARR